MSADGGPLTGGCSCGRNKYTIAIPPDAKEVARVLFDNGHHHRRSQATPLSAWLRVPLSWYQSTTYAFLSDETHAAIRKSYTSPSEQHAQRHFCGFCGTPLSYWTETPKSEAEYILLTLGSLSTEDLRSLEDLGLLPEEVEAEALGLVDVQSEREKIEGVSVDGVPYATSEGIPWFETLVEGSRLGKNMRKSVGSRRSRDGRVRVEWEILEWTEDGDGDGDGDVDRTGETLTTGKRKLGEVIDSSEDSRMEGTH